MSHRTVCRWVPQFSAGQQQMKDATPLCRPATTTTKGNIEKIRIVLKTDARFTVRQLARMTNLSLARVHGILKKHLKFRKINARWIPHLLTDKQKRTLLTMAKKNLKMYPKYSKKAFDYIVTGDETWVYYFELKRKVANRIRVTKLPVPKGRTVTGKFYKNVALRKMKIFYKSRRSKTGLQLNILLTVPRRYFFCRSSMFFLSCVCYAFLRVC